MRFRKKDNRRGVALIIVLGILALLMIMGVAFSVSMRIERRSAGNYSHSVATKNLVWAGLARAIDDIESDMNGCFYPTNDFLNTPVPVGEEYVSLGRGAAMDYIPVVLHNYAASVKSGWVNFDVVHGTGRNTSTNIPGRYAYLIINCSDFIDANYAGGATNRLSGQDARELELVDGDFTQKNLKDFLSDRDLDVRYETLNELQELTGITNEKFIAFSRYPTNDAVNISGIVRELNGKNAHGGIAKKLHDVVIRSSSDDFLYNSLINYIDENSIPSKDNMTNPGKPCLDGPYVERVPMINEVRVKRFAIIRNPDSATIRRQDITVEMAFPFVEDATEDFKTEFDVETTVTGGSSNYVFNYNTNMPVHAETSKPFEQVSLHLPNYTIDESNSVPLKINMELKGKVKISGGADDGIVVDESPSPDTKPGFIFKFDAGTTPRYQAVNEPSLECVDPRFNWDISSPYWKKCTDANNNDTLGTTNSATLAWFISNPRSRGYDTDMQMRVSNRGYLTSVGELGNLLRRANKRYLYNTVRLYNYGRGRDKVFEAFTVETNSVRRGLVNVNTEFPSMVIPAFLNVPIKYPESGDRISDLNVVSNIVKAIKDKKPATGYTNVANICDFDWKSIPGLSGYNDLEVESIIANSCRMLGVRQNLFAIIVAASPVTTGMGEVATHNKDVSALGSKRALAFVWRDPVADADGHHHCFVQFFKWL